MCTTSRLISASASANKGPEKGDLILLGHIRAGDPEAFELPLFLRRVSRHPCPCRKTQGWLAQRIFIHHIHRGMSPSTTRSRRTGAARAEDAQGTPTQSHISPSILVHEETIRPEQNQFVVLESDFQVF